MIELYLGVGRNLSPTHPIIRFVVTYLRLETSGAFWFVHSMNSAYTSLALNLQYRALFEWLHLAGVKLALGVTQQESWSALYSAACTVSALLVSLQALWPAALLCTVVVRLAWKYHWTRLHCNCRSAVPFLQHVIQEHSWNVPWLYVYVLPPSARKLPASIT